MVISDLEKSVNNEKTLLIWDTEDPPPTGNWTTILWSSFGEINDPSLISIPRLVDEHADNFKSRYLTLIYELGETLINGKRLVDHLELRPGLSYWWMTSLAQKFNVSGASQIDNAIKVIALEDLIVKRKPISIILVSGNNKFASALQNFCQTSELYFEWNNARPTEKTKSIVRLLHGYLPAPVRATAHFFRYLFISLPLLLTRKIATPALDGELSFVDVLTHLDKKSFTTEKFISNYWTTLVEELLHSNTKTNWFHNYFHQESIPSIVKAQELVDQFNNVPNKIQVHTLIESNLRFSIFISALKDYFKILRISFHLTTVSQHCIPACSALNLWPLFSQEWIDSLRGQGAMANCLRISLYEKTFSSIPHQKHGIYIQENQPWEIALIYAWKAFGHGKIIGVPHTTVRFWDLRYFYDARSYVGHGRNILPTPDLVAVNGPVAKAAYLEWGYPESRVVEVEALRFLHLLNRNESNSPTKSPEKTLRVLVCGDFLSSTNYRILSWLAIAAQSLPPTTSYVLKPHPACTIKLDKFPSLALKVSNSHLAYLLTDCDVVFTSNITSAAVDAYYSGIPVVQMLDGTTFNTSPLRGRTGVMYVTNPMELAEALHTSLHQERRAVEAYFYLDKKLPRWHKLLDLN